MSVDVRRYLTDPQLAGVAFAGESWRTWRTLLAGAFGLPLDPIECAVNARLTGGRKPLTAPCRELFLLVGRRGGKDSVSAAVAIYLATLKEWTLAVGEVGVVLVLAVDREQAKVAFRYIKGQLEASPLLAREVENITADRIVLRSGIEIQVGTSDYASVRGRTLLCVVCDEFAFVPHETAIELLRAVRPGMASQPQAMLIIISSVYSQRGPVFETFRRSYGVDDPHTLVIRAATRDTNPTISEEFIRAEIERDPLAAAAEYLSEFRGDLEGFLDVVLVDRATRNGLRELPYVRISPDGGEYRRYAALDISGGRNDATAAAVAHRFRDRVVVDACRRWPSPHDPVVVAGEVAAFLAGYGLEYATADQYGAELSRSIYRDAGISLEVAEVNRSEAYLAVLPMFTADRIEIPDDPRLRMELLALERRTGRNGKDAVDHPAQYGQHDDVANAVALAAWRAYRLARSPADMAVVAGRSTVLDGMDRNIAPAPFTSGFELH